MNQGSWLATAKRLSSLSPGLPRFAATLGTKSWNGHYPNGVKTIFRATSAKRATLG